MLTKINKIKNLGLVFQDFTWVPEVPSFKEMNLVYGWNGCGKTTLTRLFDEAGKPSGTDVEYELEFTDGAKCRQSEAFPLPIRVFNQDYVQNNVQTLESRANSISVLLGEENKDLIGEIEANERELYGDPGDPSKIGKLRELEGFKQKKNRKERGNETAFSDMARTIGAAIVGSGAASRTYRSPQAKSDFEKLTKPALLSDETLEVRIRALKQDALPTLDLLELPQLVANGVAKSFAEVMTSCQRGAEEVCALTVETETIDRLREHPDIAEWVEQGRRIHAEHKSAQCEYCGNVPTAERLAQLARYFSEADQQLKARLDAQVIILRDLHAALNGLAPHDMARLYGELQPAYEAAVDTLKLTKEHLLNEISEAGKTLKIKKGKTNEAISLQASLDVSSITATLEAVNEIVQAHNKKSAEFEKAQSEAVNAIKEHYLSTIYDEVTGRKEELKQLDPDLERREAEIEEIKRSIASARAAISSTHKACDQINAALRTFLGREELRFEPDTSDVDDGSGNQNQAVMGYRIMRGDKPAVYLSEGEKTALAFVYFVVHLSDGVFPKSNGIVVIDDPISSLDSNSLYQAFSFLKNAVKDCQQVFVLTHNFDFLKLLLNWRRRLGHTGYYMISNQFVDNSRCALITHMDRELQNYDSEYQYLFKLLKTMQAEQDGTLMRAYPVPNVARKVWETFLMYRVPNSDSPYKKMDQLKTDGFDPQKLDAIYKFTNDQSHVTGAGFDPALVPETQKVLEELFDMMGEIAPDHFAVLEKATSV